MNGKSELRIVLLGKTGVGKSSVGNAILEENVFEAKCSQKSVTQNCKKEEKEINGRKIAVIDTPGIIDTDRPEEKVKKEILACLEKCTPGPHVFILVLKVDRHTEENQQAVEKLLKYFGNDVLNHMVLLFTHGEDLDENMTIQDFIDKSDVKEKKSGKQSLKDLAERCGNRVHVIDSEHWNENSKDLAVLAQLSKTLSYSEQDMRNITDQMQLTPADKTPWFKTLTDDGGKVEAEDESKGQSMSEYRTNRFQITQLMKSIKTILKNNNGQHYRIKTLLDFFLKRSTIKKVNMVETRRSIEIAKDSLTPFTKIPEMDGGEELRIVLLGKTAAGISSVGNTILGENVFNTGCSLQSVTQICQRAEKEINSRRIVVIDTPGMFDTDRSEEDLRKEIISSLVECAPGPHVFIVVLNVDRYTKENQQVVEKCLELFSGDAVHHMVLLFTHGEDLDENVTMHDFIRRFDVDHKRGMQTLKDLVQRCGNRVHVIDNKHWNENSNDSALIARLKQLNYTEQAVRELTEKILPTPADQTPWFNVLLHPSYSVEAEHRDESEMMRYRSNIFQLTQLMKSIKHILKENNGQPYSNKNLEEIGNAINVEVENILQEMGVKRERVDMVEIRRRAVERVRTKRRCVIL